MRTSWQFCKNYFGTAFGIVILAMGATNPAHATSKAAVWLMAETVKDVCDTKDGTFKEIGIIETDLTGDGKADLVLNHGGIECSNGHRALTCGARACSVIFYVRKGDLLEMNDEILSIGAKLLPGNPPSIGLMGHNFGESTVRWNGQNFE